MVLAPELFTNRGEIIQTCCLIIKDVHITFHASCREETFGLEEGRAERTGGEMVWEGSEEPGEEVKEDGTAGRAGEGHHHPEYQHQVHHYTEVHTLCFKTQTAA